MIFYSRTKWSLSLMPRIPGGDRRMEIKCKKFPTWQGSQMTQSVVGGGEGGCALSSTLRGKIERERESK